MTVQPKWTWRRGYTRDQNRSGHALPGFGPHMVVYPPEWSGMVRGPKLARAWSGRFWSSYCGEPTRMVRDGPWTKTGQGMLWPVLVLGPCRTILVTYLGYPSMCMLATVPPPTTRTLTRQILAKRAEKTEKNKLNKQTATKGGTRLVPKSALRLGPTSRLQKNTNA